MAKSKTKRNLYIFAGLILFFVVFFVIANKAGWINKKEGEEVEVAKAEYKQIIEKVSASGKIQPEVEVKISPDVSGEIIELHVAEGDSVKQGQLLLKIRPDNYESMLDRAKASVNNSKAALAQARAQAAQAKARQIRTKADFDRNKVLYEQKVISDADFETIKANYAVSQEEVNSARQSVQAAIYNVQSAEASLKDANENLRKTQIYAPVSGIVSKLNIEKGERVVGTSQMAGTEIMRIANLNNMEVRVDVNENDIVRVHIGDTADIEVDSYSQGNLKFSGIVTSIANTAKETQTQDAVTEFQVKVRILNDSYSNLATERASPFRPGMTASVEIITDKKENVLTVPLAAVTTRNPNEKKTDESTKDKNFKEVNNAPPASAPKQQLKEVVFVLDSGKVKMAEVKTGISDFDNIEILSGIKPNQQIVAGPFITVSKRLNDGDIIKIKEANAKDKAKENK